MLGVHQFKNYLIYSPEIELKHHASVIIPLQTIYSFALYLSNQILPTVFDTFETLYKHGKKSRTNFSNLAFQVIVYVMHQRCAHCLFWFAD